MSTQTQIADDQNPFSVAVERFEALTTSLAGSEALAMDHSGVEQLVANQGQQLLQALMQGHMDLRSFEDAGPVLVGADGAERRRRRTRAVPLRTLVGDVRVQRDIYALAGSTSLAPLDAALNLPPNLYSYGVREQVAIEASRGAYDDATEAVQRLALVKVPKRQAIEIAHASAVDFADFYAACPTQNPETDATQEACDFVVLTTDGKGVVMRPEGLTAKTRKTAEQALPKLDARISKGEKPHRKRMAQVASVYAIAPWIRRPEDFIRELRPVKDPSMKRPRPQSKRVWASLQQPVEGVMSDMFEAATKRDPLRQKRWVGLVDGNKNQLGNMMALAKHHDVEMTIIVDIIHVLEYIWKAAWCFFDEGDKAAQRWVETRVLCILQGRCSDVAAGIRRTATHRNLSLHQHRNADKAADYLLKYKQFLRYDVYLAAGMPIATGVIEGACRYLVKDRMEVTGARWGLDGAESVLKLRAIRASGDWDEYWKFHKQKELKRNHLARYQKGKVPEMRPVSVSEAKRAHLRVVK